MSSRVASRAAYETACLVLTLIFVLGLERAAEAVSNLFTGSAGDTLNAPDSSE